MVKAENLSFGYTDKDLYKKISFTIEDGRHCVFIGTNGTGKSTLVNMIMEPGEYMYSGKLKLKKDMRIGHVSQFVDHDKTIHKSVFEYLSEDFIKTQKLISDLCDEMGTTDDLEPVLEKYQAAFDGFNAIDGDNYDSNIRKQLKLAGLEKMTDSEVSILSGGEFKLIQILKQMLVIPDLLIMDEPDVFLDFENLCGLRDLINSYKGTMLVITHNRFLLNNCFDKIIHLENADIQEFDGGYVEYNYNLLCNKVELMELAAADDAEIERNEKLVEKFRTAATIVSDASKGRALGARVSLLERLKARRIKAPFVEVKEPKIEFPIVDEKSLESDTGFVLSVSDYQVSFEEKILSDVTFTIEPQDKAAIVGGNGTGKTTLLRDIYKNDNSCISYGEDTKVSLLSQAAVEMLNEKLTPIDVLGDYGFEKKEEIIEYLSGYGFDEDLMERKIEYLSGGEKNLLQLAMISKSDSNLLLLDEPTSHLDIYSQLSLEKAVKEYKGAILMVSHDFYTIANCMDYVLFIEDKTVRRMSIRKFRQMIYANHFTVNYLELEQKKKELETKITELLRRKDFESAKVVCEELEPVIEKMK